MSIRQIVVVAVLVSFLVGCAPQQPPPKKGVNVKINTGKDGVDVDVDLQKPIFPESQGVPSTPRN